MEPRITITIPDGVTEEDIARAMIVHAAMRQEFVDVMTGRDREKDAAFARAIAEEAAMEPRPVTQTRSVQAEDLNIARRVADYYVSLRGRAVHEPALSTCTVAFQDAITRTNLVHELVIGEEDSAT